jgi:hypothetical protein
MEGRESLLLTFIQKAVCTSRSGGYSFLLSHLENKQDPSLGRAIAQAVSRWLPTAVARVQTRV